VYNASLMLAPDTVLQGRYRIVRQLGQGGMGAVYEAMDERLDTVVALKETLFTDERLRKQFEREARLLARMHHPALPRVSDHFAEGEGQFLVMQFIAGDDLDQMMKEKQGPFPPDQVMNWGDQLLDALDYLHTQDPQIIHRDIKPQNLKITSRGQIILLDFGLAKGQSGGVSVVTTSASIFGYTPNYAPLEQIQGVGTDARSDIYALSATLYHLMTAVKPPDALTRATALVNGQPDPLVPANAISGNIGPEIAGVIARGMSQSRDQRYATAAGMRAALNGSGEVATLAGRSEAATVILSGPTASSEAATRIESPAKLTAMPGETTIVQTPRAGKSRFAPLALVAAAVVLIGIVVGGLYAYRRSNNSTPATGVNPVAQESPSPQPTQAITSVAVDPAATNTPDTKKAEQTGQRVEANAKKIEKAAQKTVESSGSNAVPDFPQPPKVDPNAQQKTAVEPPVVRPEDFDNPEFDKFKRRRQGAGAIRSLPDGSRIMTSPNGARVLVMPDGTTRILRPPMVRRRQP
jgi:eukaryotic-like serine/threonine-protein kinase